MPTNYSLESKTVCDNTFYSLFFITSDLARIESDAQIKNLVSQIEELQKQKDAEVMNARTESSEIENILKTSFQEEFEALKSKASEALKNSENEVKYEQLRRQQLQIHLTESESQLLSKIRLLEETNMELQKRADQGDLESTRLKMKILHENISQGL